MPSATKLQLVYAANEECTIRRPAGNLEAFPAPLRLEEFLMDGPTVSPRQRRHSAVAVSAAFAGRLPHPPHQPEVARSYNALRMRPEIALTKELRLFRSLFLRTLMPSRQQMYASCTSEVKCASARLDGTRTRRSGYARRKFLFKLSPWLGLLRLPIAALAQHGARLLADSSPGNATCRFV